MDHDIVYRLMHYTLSFLSLSLSLSIADRGILSILSPPLLAGLIGICCGILVVCITCLFNAFFAMIKRHQTKKK